MMKKTYLYILGYGRSGSTLLDWQLDSHPDILGIGEISRLPSSIYDVYQLPEYCACGQRLYECEFWKPLLEQGRRLKREDLKFNAWNSRLIKYAFNKASDVDVLVDSSGNLERLQKIMNSDIAKKYNIKVLFFTRDARAVIYSAHKKGYLKGKFKPNLLRATIGWWYRHKQFIRFVRKLDDESCIHVKYEEFCESPNDVMIKLQKFLDVKPIGIVKDWRHHIHHTFAGNYRLRMSNKNLIRQDISWTYKLGWYQSIIVEIVTGRLNRLLLNRIIK